MILYFQLKQIVFPFTHGKHSKGSVNDLVKDFNFMLSSHEIEMGKHNIDIYEINQTQLINKSNHHK
jgi:hypothetical protein